MSWIIGTRGSLLALEQSRRIARLLEERGQKCRLEIIKTRGDAEQGAPLWSLEGKDFFTRELDQALLSGKVDLTVHSCKDLGTERPEGITTAAITERNYPQDILLARLPLPSGLLRVGTSSPRRTHHLNALKELIPGEWDIRGAPLRGNVTTRLEKLRRGEYDAIILALAGLERLAHLPQLQELVSGLEYMVLPASLFPPAPAQGALAVEVSENAPAPLAEALRELDHPTTRAEVMREREIFGRHGGGCHLALGVSAQKIHGRFFMVAGGTVDGKIIEKRGLSGERPPCKGDVFVGLPPEKLPEHILGDELIKKIPLPTPGIKLDPEEALLVSSAHCLPLPEDLSPAALIASGVHTRRRLARAGRWVHLCADGRGEEEIASILRSNFLNLLRPISEVRILTNDTSTSVLGPTFPCYRRQVGEPSADFARRLGRVECFYWTSFFQYQSYLKRFPAIRDKQHACGLGKTRQAFAQAGAPVILFSCMEEFYNWAGM